MNLKKTMIAMLVVGPSFVATSVIATADTYNADNDEAASDKAAYYEAVILQHLEAEEAARKSMSDDTMDPGPDCQPWPYCVNQ